jgi:hypothetical protein
MVPTIACQRGDFKLFPHGRLKARAKNRRQRCNAASAIGAAYLNPSTKIMNPQMPHPYFSSGGAKYLQNPKQKHIPSPVQGRHMKGIAHRTIDTRCQSVF